MDHVVTLVYMVRENINGSVPALFEWFLIEVFNSITQIQQLPTQEKKKNTQIVLICNLWSHSVTSILDPTAPSFSNCW